MKEIVKDAFVALLFFSGVLGFVFGEFIISTVLFGSAAVSSNIFLSQRLQQRS